MEDSTEKLHKTKQEYRCEVCEFVTTNKSNYKQHLGTDKHKKNVPVVGENHTVFEKTPKKTYSCEVCNYNTINIAKYNLHCNTKKHQKRVQNNSSSNPPPVVNPPVEQPMETPMEPSDETESVSDASVETDDSTDGPIPQNDDPNETITIPKRLYTNMMGMNKDLIRESLNQSKQIQDLRLVISEQEKKISELIKENRTKTTNTTTNITTNNNQEYNININVYLNEACRNALTWTDFINNVRLTYDGLVYKNPSIENGSENEISDNVNNCLQQLVASGSTEAVAEENLV